MWQTSFLQSGVLVDLNNTLLTGLLLSNCPLVGLEFNVNESIIQFLQKKKATLHSIKTSIVCSKAMERWKSSLLSEFLR